jgi:hypothetical protein
VRHADPPKCGQRGGVEPIAPDSSCTSAIEAVRRGIKARRQEDGFLGWKAAGLAVEAA